MYAQRVTVRAPATTANLGPGFDCLGMALDLWNLVRLEVAPRTRVEVKGEGADSLSKGADNLVFRSVEALFHEAQLPLPSLRLTCRNRIPLARGLGSSSAAAVGGLVAANALCGYPLPRERLLELAADVEGHPDNVAPALLGGCRIVVQEEGKIIAPAVPLPKELYAVLFVPDMTIPTQEARAILPAQVSREDAIFNLSHTALVVHALYSGQLDHLPVATQDRLHQPYRQRIFPAMKVIFRAAMDTGALGVFLSGAGPTVLALAKGQELTIGYEMADAAHKAGVEGEIKILRPTTRGAHVVSVR